MGRFDVGAVSPGQTAPFDDFLALPDGIPAGNFFVTGVIDPDHAVAESNKKNNGGGSPLSEVHVAGKETAAPAQQGLDPHFGIGGVADVALSGKPFAATATVADSQGRLVVVGSELDNFDSVMFRINTDGTLDTTFGTNGLITTDVQNGNLGQPLAIQPDGKILLAAERDDSASLSDPALFHLVLLRFQPRRHARHLLRRQRPIRHRSLFPLSPWQRPHHRKSPLRDRAPPRRTFLRRRRRVQRQRQRRCRRTFSPQWISRQNLQWQRRAFLDIHHNDDEGVSIAVQKDEKVVIVGSTTGNDENGDILAARFDVNGRLDATFADRGIFTIGPTGQTTGAHAVVIQPDGKIVLSGSSSIGSLETGDSGSPLYTIRLTSSGHLDDSFGHDGTITTEIPDFTNATASNVFLDPHGRIVVAGTIARTTADFLNDRTGLVLVRYTPDGQIDTSFGVNGIDSLFDPPKLLAPAAPASISADDFSDFQRTGAAIVDQTPGGGIFALAALVTDGQTLVAIDDVAVDAPIWRSRTDVTSVGQSWNKSKRLADDQKCRFRWLPARWP